MWGLCVAGNAVEQNIIGPTMDSLEVGCLRSKAEYPRTY